MPFLSLIQQCTVLKQQIRPIPRHLAPPPVTARASNSAPADHAHVINAFIVLYYIVKQYAH